MKHKYNVIGMHCASCASRVQKTVSTTEGVKEASVNFANNTILIDYEDKITDIAKIKKTLQNAGYDIETDEKSQKEKEQISDKKYKSQKTKVAGAFVCAIVIMFLSMAGEKTVTNGILQMITASATLIFFGRDFFAIAYKQLTHRNSNMDTLVALSTSISYIYSLFNLYSLCSQSTPAESQHLYFDSSAMIIAFVLTGRLLEAKAKNNASNAIKKLAGLTPKTVEVVSADGTTIEKDIDKIEIGDIVEIKPGDKIAVDGTIEAGQTFIDESMLTGEQNAVSKQNSDYVYAGTINQDGLIRVRADKKSKDTTLQKIISMVEEAQGSRTKVQQTVDKIASVFVPVIIAISIITLIAWLFIDQENGLEKGIIGMVSVLVVACPCSLGLATPMALIVGIGRGAKLGILIRDASCLETAEKIDSIVLDKTGTITENEMKIKKIEWADEIGDKEKYENIISNIESKSKHPLAKSISKNLGIKHTINIEENRYIAGNGIEAIFDGKTYKIGTRKFATDGLDTFGEGDEGNTSVYVSENNIPLCKIEAKNEIKKDAKESVEILKKSGIEVIILSGDKQENVKHIADKLGVGKYKGEEKPQDKARFIKELQQQGHVVAMAGDGINDSVAMAQSDLSIAMGNGTDIAIEIAQTTIVSSDLQKIWQTIALSSATIKTIKENLTWAFFYNIMTVPIAAGVLSKYGIQMSPMICAAAMSMSSLSVSLNSIRLRYKKLRLTTHNKKQENREVETYTEYDVKGMMCVHCRKAVEDALNKVEGIRASVDLDKNTATISTKRTDLTVEELKNAIEKYAGEYEISEK